MSRPQTLCEAFQQTAAARGEALALRGFDSGQEFTWHQYAAEVERIAGGLAALGVGHGDTVATMLTNRPEFNLVETAASHLGATTFSIYNTSSVDQVAYLLEHAGTSVVVTERAFLDRIRSAAPADLTVLTVDDGDLDALTPATDFDFASTWRSVRPGDVACLIYTSGTTGSPKGVEMTHANLLALADSVSAVFPMSSADRGVSYLPSSHIADRCMGHYFHLLYGSELTCVADAARMVEALPQITPTYIVAVPRFWEKIKLGVELQLRAAPEMAEALAAGNPQVAAALRAKLGLDGLRWAMSGSAAIPPEVYRFLTVLGLPVSEVWGMSECGLASGADPSVAKNGTIGPLLPGIEGKLLADGELLIRGATVMKGYRNEPAKTAEAIDAEGWLHTGDIATIDDDGFLAIVDRKKELIIGAGGKNMSPANIENAISSASPLIAHVAVIGDARPYNVGLIVLDPEATAAFGFDLDPDALAADTKVHELVRESVEAGNARLSRVEQIKKFTILPTFWEPGSDEMTPTSKLRRKQITTKYAEEIDELYA